MTEPEIPPALAPFRHRLAIGALVGMVDLDESAIDAMAAFWPSVPTLDSDFGEVAAVGVTVGSRFDRMAWRATGPTSLFLDWVAELLDRDDNAEGAFERFVEAGRFVDPDAIGAFIEGAPDGTRLGWRMPGPLRLATALALVPEHDALQRVYDWVRRQHLDTCLQLGGWVTAPDAHLDVCVALGEPSSQREVVEDGLKTIGVALPDAALEMLAGQDGGELAMSLRFSGQGIARLGVQALSPTLPQALQLLRGAGQKDHRRLALIEGWMGSDRPSAAEWFVDADGHGVEMHYDFGPQRLQVN